MNANEKNVAPKATNKPKMVKIKLPISKTEKNDVFVGVNGKTFLIKRGVDVEVPDYVVEVLKHKEEMLIQQIEYEAQASANNDADELKK